MATLARHKAQNTVESKIPTDPLTLMGLGIGAVVVIWLIFSVVKKMVGIAIVLALAAGAWFLWTNPQYLAPIMAQIRHVNG
ncbi:hypothetical protein [Devosia sp.]|uniref:hypothetical protein n=1 Tax=Devosia sp. TaxID=1871048 RepID=UPI001B1A4D6A|nr:hypothetical protein [Devosia sp.]MBO9590370.1 hypothetical protein [Devosia sp.]